MESFIWIGFAAFFIASSTVGLRLVALWRRNGELPELLIGIGVLGIGPAGFGAMTIGQLLHAEHELLGRVVYACGLAAASGGALSKFVFNTYVYRRRSAIAKAVTVFAGGTLVACLVANGVVNGFRNINVADGFYAIRTLLTVGCLLWGSAEAVRYWGLMRRRAKLGLADPVVTNRFLLWGIGAGAAGLGTTVGVIAQWSTGLAPVEIPWVMLSSSLHGMVAAVAMWFAFLPPEAYRRYVSRRAAASVVA